MATTTATPTKVRKPRAPRARKNTDGTPGGTTGAILPKGCKLTGVLSKDATRPILCNAHVTYSEKRGAWELHATDSYMAVRIPVEPKVASEQPQLLPGTVDRATVKHMEDGAAIVVEQPKDRKQKIGGVSRTVRPKQTVTVSGGKLLAGATYTYDRDQIGQFPDLDKLWPKRDADTFEVGLNAEYLYRLAKAMGAEAVKLSFKGDRKASKAIEVTPLNRGKSSAPIPAPDARGLLMPVRLSV